jgi:hypothetical protein
MADATSSRGAYRSFKQILHDSEFLFCFVALSERV